MMYHHLDDDAPGWACATCGLTWSGALEFIGDPRDCRPTWRDRARADQVAPIVWVGVADEYATCELAGV